jgi:hypothetical protein
MGGFYTEDEVSALIPQLKVKGGEDYVIRTAKALGPMLIKAPSLYKLFGVCWWTIKDAIVRHAPIQGAWFMGGFFDFRMKARAWHGDEFRTVLAGAYYQSNHFDSNATHSWMDNEGEDHEYDLFDQDAGF